MKTFCFAAYLILLISCNVAKQNGIVVKETKQVDKAVADTSLTNEKLKLEIQDQLQSGNRKNMGLKIY